MKKIALAAVTTVLLASGAASAQEFGVRIGPSGVEVGPNRYQGRRYGEDERVIVRRERRSEIDETGSTSCRTTIIKREDDCGRMITKRIRTCD